MHKNDHLHSAKTTFQFHSVNSKDSAKGKFRKGNSRALFFVWKNNLSVIFVFVFYFLILLHVF